MNTVVFQGHKGARTDSRATTLCWIVGLFITFGLVQSVQADGASRFRGANGNGVYDASALPAEFSPEKNAVWKSEIPFARSSPVLVGDQVLITGADEESLLVLSLDAATGKEQWRGEVDRARDGGIFKDNDSASSTPATDGENVYAFFQELGLVSFTLEGEHRWTAPLGPFHSFYGIGASPIVAGDLVIMVCDQQKGSFMVAVGKDDGKVRWRNERGLHGAGFSTPILYPSSDNPEVVVVHGESWLDAYTLADGSHAWGVAGLGASPTPSPILDGDRLYIVAPNEAEDNFPFPTFEDITTKYDADKNARITKEELGTFFLAHHFGWVDADRSGDFGADEYAYSYKSVNTPEFGLIAFDLSPTANGGEPTRLWTHKKKLPKHSTPVLADGVIFTVTGGGIVTSLDAESGKVLKQGRIPDAGGPYHSSPVVADGKVYMGSNAGKMSVLSAEGEWEVLAVNEFGEKIEATPTAGGERLYIRTEKALYCVGE